VLNHMGSADSHEICSAAGCATVLKLYRRRLPPTCLSCCSTSACLLWVLLYLCMSVYMHLQISMTDELLPAPVSAMMSCCLPLSLQ
jgi:hypothetical protein